MAKFGKIALTVYVTIATLAAILFGYFYFTKTVDKEKVNALGISKALCTTIGADLKNLTNRINNSSASTTSGTLDGFSVSSYSEDTEKSPIGIPYSEYYTGAITGAKEIRGVSETIELLNNIVAVGLKNSFEGEATANKYVYYDYSGCKELNDEGQVGIDGKACSARLTCMPVFNETNGTLSIYIEWYDNFVYGGYYQYGELIVYLTNDFSDYIGFTLSMGGINWISREADRGNYDQPVFVQIYKNSGVISYFNLLNGMWTKDDTKLDGYYRINLIDIDFDKGKILSIGYNASSEAKEYYDEYDQGILDKYSVFSKLEKYVEYASQVGLVVKHQLGN